MPEEKPADEKKPRRVVKKLLPKGDEGVLVEVMRQLSRDMRKFADYMLTSNAEDCVRAEGDAERKKLMEQIVSDLAIVKLALARMEESESEKKMLDHILKLDNQLQNFMMTKTSDIIKWGLWIATCALLAAGMIKLYTGWP